MNKEKNEYLLFIVIGLGVLVPLLIPTMLETAQLESFRDYQPNDPNLWLDLSALWIRVLFILVAYIFLNTTLLLLIFRKKDK